MHVDGHEKLNHLALKLDDITLPIYGARDQFSSKILLLITAPNVRFADSAGHFFLDLVEELGCTTYTLDIKTLLLTKLTGVPVTVVSDKGSEIGKMKAFQEVLRYVTYLLPSTEL